MEEKKLEIIMQLMEELQEEMKPGVSDFSERLGRKEEPKLASVELEVEGDPMMEDDHMDMEEESPESKLKSRLMKLRG